MDLSIKLGLVLAILLAIGYGVYAIRRWGQQAERGQAAQDSNEVKDEQLEIAVDGPRTKDAVLERLRKKGL